MNHERSKRNDPDKRFDWEFFAIAMAGETGEILNNLKKIKRGDFLLDKEKFAEEAADVLTYAFLLLSELGVDPEKVLLDKFKKVNDRLDKGGFHIRN